MQIKLKRRKIHSTLTKSIQQSTWPYGPSKYFHLFQIGISILSSCLVISIDMKGTRRPVARALPLQLYYVQQPGYRSTVLFFQNCTCYNQYVWSNYYYFVFTSTDRFGNWTLMLKHILEQFLAFWNHSLASSYDQQHEKQGQLHWSSWFPQMRLDHGLAEMQQICQGLANPLPDPLLAHCCCCKESSCFVDSFAVYAPLV